MMKSSRIWYRLRGALIVPFYLFAVMSFPGLRAGDGVVFVLGSLLFGIGLFLRIWAQAHLHYRLKERKDLTVTGPYEYVRNPIYLGNTYLMAGVTLMAGLIWFVPVMLVVCALTYHLTVRYEEGHLLEKYGSGYREYCRRVPRWIPRVPEAEIAPSSNLRRYLFPSILAESHIMLLLTPLALKALWLAH